METLALTPAAGVRGAELQLRAIAMGHNAQSWSSALRRRKQAQFPGIFMLCGAAPPHEDLRRLLLF